MMTVVLRKGTAAAHYVMGGPTANRHNAFTLGIPTTEIYVMHGETAAAASFSRRLVKEKDAGNPLDPVIDKIHEEIDEVQRRLNEIGREIFEQYVLLPSEIREVLAVSVRPFMS